MIQPQLALIIQPDVKIRNIEQKDWLRVTSFHVHLYSDLYSLMTIEERDRHIVFHNKRLDEVVNKKWGFIAEVSGVSQGYALFELANRRVHVREVYVSPKLRKLGIGRKLMRAVGLSANYYPFDIVLEASR